MSHHSFHQITSLHVPAEQFLSDKRFHSFVKQITKKLYRSPNPSDCQLIVLGYDDVAALVEPEQKIRSLAKVNNISLLGDVPDAVRKLEVLEALVLDVPKLEPVQSGRTTPLLGSF